MKQLWYVSLFLAILLGSTVLASTQVYADTQFVGTETAIISKNDTIKSVDESFTLYGLKPYFYTGDVFDATFDVTVDWHGCAVAAAFMPAVFDVYQYTNLEYSGKIIEKYPSLVGLIAVFRGSHHTGTTLGAEWTEDYMLMDGKIYLEVKVEYPKYYAYTITVYTETTVKKEIIEIAWAKARVGLSAELNVLNLVDVSYELAHVELGVEAQIIMSETTTSGYRYTVQFIVPVSSKITINYQACVNVTYVYIAHNENGPVPTSYEIGDKHSTALGPEGGFYNETRKYVLNACGTWIAYSTFDYNPYQAYKEFNGDGTTGTIIFG